MKVVLAGASGFIGNLLVPALRSRGIQAVTLVRRPTTGFDQHRWDPGSGLDPRLLAGADAVINLAGAGIGAHRWTQRYRQELLTSRLTATSAIARACAQARVPLLLNSSAVGIYGHLGDEPVDESARPGGGFLAGLCRDWESATSAAADGGTRVITLRTALVLGDAGGVLPTLALITRLFAGGRLGSGRQYFPWISAEDVTGSILHLLSADVAGPVNLVAPQQVTNAEFTRELGRALHRPTPWIVPRLALRLVLGGFADELVTGQRVVPTALIESGYPFAYPTLTGALAAGLK